MDIRDLRYLLAIADCKTLTGAAQHLHVSRQAVGKALRQIEGEAGARLFERHSGALVPTERGRSLVTDAREVVEAFDGLCDAHLCPTVTDSGRRDGRRPARESLLVALVIGGADALPRHLFDAFVANSPQTTLDVEEMSTDMVLDAVASGNVDVGIVGSHPDLLAGFETCCIMPVGVWLLAPSTHPLAYRSPLSLPDLDGVTMVTTGKHNHLHRFVMQRCADAGVRPDVRATTTVLGRLAFDLNALCFGYPPSLMAPPAGTVALELQIDGGQKFGTYAIRRAEAGSSGSARLPSRSARRFWDLAMTIAERGGQS